LDFRSGLGHAPERRRGQGPRYLVTDLGQFDFVGGKMRLTHLHPNVASSRVAAKTGFELAKAPEVKTTPPPSERELHLLRTEIDPLGIRRLEAASGAERRRLIREILASESAASMGR
jgi:glutaconate CoA-transferase subunit A